MTRFIYIFICTASMVLSADGQIKPHKFKKGDMLPDLILVDAFGDTTTTAELKGHKVLITFNRYVSCPLCNFRTHELLNVYDSLKKMGFVLISVYESGKETLLEYTGKEDIPFIMIPDPDLSLYKLFKIQKSWIKSFTGLFHRYGAKHKTGREMFSGSYKRDGSLNRIGADFLVDEEGKIFLGYYGKYVGDHYPINDIVKWGSQ